MKGVLGWIFNREVERVGTGGIPGNRIAGGRPEDLNHPLTQEERGRHGSRYTGSISSDHREAGGNSRTHYREFENGQLVNEQEYDADDYRMDRG